jgi:general secretion pathway protein A
MFLKFFGLKDNPFKLVFDPAYLFMGRHHEEAAAHLRYAVAEGEGFTVITGERGVGKSTLCRAFAGRVADEAEAAFISSPVATARDLLQRINQEFGVRGEGETAKELIDALNGFLMQQRVAGKKVVVFIDDAQALAPEVLEQVRLISNLETTRDKLIQIVLIGEPELTEMLGSRELRQMGQRVSVCYEIGALTEAETASYIQHRLSLASEGPPVRFDPAAVRRIFQHSDGNPRRINIAGNAVLAAAFKARQKEVDAGIAQAVFKDPERQDGRAPDAAAAAGRTKRMGALAAAGGVLLAAAAVFVILQPAEERPVPAVEAGSSAPLAAVAPEPVATELSAAATPVPEHQPTVPEAAAPLENKTPAPAREGRARMTHSVQVGAYLYPENAQQVTAQLTAKGYPARIFKFTDAKGRIWHTVRIGDHPSRQTAQTQADEFSRREQMKTVVRPFGGF